jgi:16S rRNA (guanine(966)-N(2))-methyltransferase RsmD
MRVISGIKKGIRLTPLKNPAVRPTTDRTKEVIFNVLGGWLEDKVVLDIFAGTGSLGIEALSRGAAKAIFIEQNRFARRTIVENLTKTDFLDRAEILQLDAGKALRLLAKRAQKYDTIFLDPPYGKGVETAAIALVAQHDLMNRDGRLVIEHSAKTDLGEHIGIYRRISIKKIGDTEVSFFSYEN